MRYEEKDNTYYSNIRLDLLSLLPKDSSNLKVLEVGAGTGATLSYLKEQKIAAEVVGVDIPESKVNSIPSTIDKFIYGDAESLDLSEYDNYFDCIIFADVLEHLVHPKELLIKLKTLLKDEGCILISIPNIRHKKALYKIFIKGNFSYEESGLFDYTHLRFFCKKNIKQLVSDGGYEIEQMVSSLKTYNKPSSSKILNTITFRIFEEFLSVQYLVKAKKSN